MKGNGLGIRGKASRGATGGVGTTTHAAANAAAVAASAGLCWDCVAVGCVVATVSNNLSPSILQQHGWPMYVPYSLAAIDNRQRYLVLRSKLLQ